VRRMILIVLLVSGLAVGTVVMSQPPFPNEPFWYIEITGLNNFSLFGPTPGTYTGSDDFQVGVNNPTGATVTSSISAFTPPLTNPATTDVVLADVPQGITECTVSASVNIVLLDAPGTYQATLTVTVTNKPQ